MHPFVFAFAGFKNEKLGFVEDSFVTGEPELSLETFGPKLNSGFVLFCDCSSFFSLPTLPESVVAFKPPNNGIGLSFFSSD